MGTTSDVKESNFFDVKLCVVISLLSWPICYFVNTGIKTVDEDKRSLVLMSVGFVALATIIFVVKTFSKLKNWIGYVLVLFSFTSMCDLIIAIEFKGWIKGFMTEYLQIGEPYLNSPWGYAVTLFDGLCFYSMYLMLIHRISNGKPWRSVGIYWVSGLCNSMIVLLFGVAAGKHPPTFCTFLNVPYAIIPIFIAKRLFSREKEEGWCAERIKANGFIFDLIVGIGLLFSIWLIFVKGMLSIGSQFKIFQNILSHERALLSVDPAPFLTLQSLIFLFYSLPILITSLICIFRKRKPQILWDLALINGGLILQGQLTYIVTALDSKTSQELRSDPLDLQFWINNLTLLIVPQLLLWNWYRSNVEVTGGTKKSKKNN